MNKYKKRYQKVNSINNKNKKLNGSDDGLNKEQSSNYILRSSTYTWQNYCKNSPWIYHLVNSSNYFIIINFFYIIILPIIYNII